MSFFLSFLQYISSLDKNTEDITTCNLAHSFAESFISLTCIYFVLSCSG